MFYKVKLRSLRLKSKIYKVSVYTALINIKIIHFKTKMEITTSTGFDR